MRLSRIKLAGFKSFVDPTTFQLPSNLVGIVGPNGCGKSNVIDAVRWVMGEMSAKHLRGDSMADVIFNGSASRKPVGTASIELFFDNSDGSIGGQYAQYAEISLKRAISRDGTSAYFLNNTRCRRKDITDLFLGTGLGSRSYAIIEQGMVSRLVDAKPDDMRNYIEEAAGISKYKERRRETESRIQHTRDNLARLTDLRDEIGKQIDYLQRQAKAAERYKDMKSRERRLDAELLALKLRAIDGSLEGARSDLSRRHTELEAANAAQRKLEAEIVAARELHVSATDAFNQVQARHYGVQSEISRLEQSIGHTRDLRDRHQADLHQVKEQLAAVSSEIESEREALEQLDARLSELAPKIETASQAEKCAGISLQEAESAMREWQSEWHDFNLEIRAHQHAVEVARTSVEHVSAQLGQLRRQREVLERDQGGIPLEALGEKLQDQESLERQASIRAEDLQEQLNQVGSEADALRERELACGKAMEALTADLASRRGQAETIETVQQAALGAEDSVLGAWMSRESLANRPRLAQSLRAEKKWLLAVETVLGDFLQAVCVEDAGRHLSALPDTQVVLVEAGPGGYKDVPHEGRLLAHVGNPGRATPLLGSVIAATDLEDAIAKAKGMAPQDSVITPDGVWLGHGWVRVNRGQRSQSGILAREQKLRELKEAIARDEIRIDEIETDRAAARVRLDQVANRRIQLTTEFNLVNREHAEAVAVLQALKAEIDRSRDRKITLESRIAEIDLEISAAINAQSEGLEIVTAAEEALESLLHGRPRLEQQQGVLITACNDARVRASAARDELSRLNIEAESGRAMREAAAQTLARLQAQHNQLALRTTTLDDQLKGAIPALQSLQEDLSRQLEMQLSVDRLLSDQRGQLEEIESRLRGLETGRAASEKTVGSVRESVDGLRLHVRELEIRRESVVEDFAANGAVLETVLQEMPADAEQGRWQESLEDVRRKIERLGPINLAAIEQFNEQSERKRYLDAQNDDLMSALETLEQAIRKIDRESRSRFQETFDNVNQGLKRIFPRLFGGGHAYLSLEGEEILSAGVTVMARPPGKRNSHIHLLSGGEKALTAVALIFAIFELNPAPFCLLDEVDAPLDEANVGRFCDIVREMAQRVQFVVITHNKTTMEMAHQLTGVTMNEPGVSRLVSVDLDAAVQLAAS